MEENTYKTKPDTYVKVSPFNQLLEQEVSLLFENVNYDPSASEELSSKLIKNLHSKIQTQVPPRYKFVVVVHVGELKDQTMRITSRWLWDHQTDNFASYSYKNASLYCSASIYFVYQE
ncbi:hypothetical protein P9112_005416 [Eukaryota sp. TZLM1-RC]